jgi:FtsZ-interacting cell division protein ZipA
VGPVTNVKAVVTRIIISGFILITILLVSVFNCSAESFDSFEDVDSDGNNNRTAYDGPISEAKKEESQMDVSILALVVIISIVVPAVIVGAILIVLWAQRRERMRNPYFNMQNNTSTIKPGEVAPPNQTVQTSASELGSPPEQHFPFPSDFDRSQKTNQNFDSYYNYNNNENSNIYYQNHQNPPSFKY